MYHEFLMINCDSCVFEKDVSFFGIIPKSRAIFTNATFKSVCNFKKSRFMNGADFSNTSFSQNADFGYIESEKDIDFNGAYFSRDALFWSGNFNDKVEFSYVNFVGDAVFIGSRFLSGHFTNTVFYAEARFDDCFFGDRLVIKGASFKEDINLERADLGKHLIIDNVKVSGIIRLRDAILPDTIELRDIDITLPLDMDICRPNPKGISLLYLKNIDTTKIWLDFSFMRLWFPPDCPMDINARDQLYKELISLERERKRTKSLMALEEQYRQFIELGIMY